MHASSRQVSLPKFPHQFGERVTGGAAVVICWWLCRVCCWMYLLFWWSTSLDLISGLGVWVCVFILFTRQSMDTTMIERGEGEEAGGF